MLPLPMPTQPLTTLFPYHCYVPAPVYEARGGWVSLSSFSMSLQNAQPMRTVQFSAILFIF